MDVVLGVAVAGPVARLALVGPGAHGADVIDQSVVDLADNPINTLTQTVVGTNRLLADENHRLVATRLCWDDGKADQLRQSLEDSGVQNVAVLSQSQAVTALMRAAGRAGGVLVVDDETATLSMVGGAGDENAPPTLLASEPLGADATAALDTMMARLADLPGAPTGVYLVGASSDLTGVADQLRDASTMQVEIPDDPTFALARGAALAAAPLAAASASDATAMAPAVGLTADDTAFAPAAEVAGAKAEEPQLAYSQAEEGESFPGEMDEYGPEFDEYDDFDEGADGAPARLSRRSLLIGNAVIAFAVIGFASLAAAVVIAVRPTASQAPVVGHQNAAPGKFMPLLPTQQQAPVPPPPPDAPNAGFQGGTVPAPTVGGSVPQQGPPAVGGLPPVAPAPVGPETPGTPGFVPNPNPNVPIPIPIIIPFPGWHPTNPYPNPYPYPYPPPTAPTTPYTPPTTTQTPPTTTPPSTPPTTPPTTTHTPPTTTYSPPTTTYSPPTTTNAPPTTTNAPPTTTYSPPTTQPSTPKTTVPTSVAPPPSTKPPTQTVPPQTVPPQTHSQQPVTPQQPVSPQQPASPQQPHGRHGF